MKKDIYARVYHWPWAVVYVPNDGIGYEILSYHPSRDTARARIKEVGKGLGYKIACISGTTIGRILK